MGLGSRTLDFVRGVFKRHEYQNPPSVPILTTFANAGSSYFAQGMTVGTLQGVTDYLRLDADLVARYIDLEDQDDSPLVSSALDIYADDSVQTDITNGRAVWVESKDERVRAELDDLLNKIIKVEEDIWMLARTMWKYGNAYAEIVAKEGSGVIALNYLPPPTVRRIEIPKEIGRAVSQRQDLDSDTLGFVYDPKGLFQISTADFIAALDARAMGESDSVMAKSKTAPQSSECAVFESWEMMHIRLRGKNPYGVYGHGVGEAARWIFKRLVLLEDSIILHRLCLRGDTNVWTTSGYKKIKDLNEGDEVYSYGKDLALKKTKVVYKKHNGQDKIFRIKSKHREIYANATHPVLVEIEHHQGSGKPILRGMEYVEVKNIVPGQHKFVCPKVEENNTYSHKLVFPEKEYKSRLKKEFCLDKRPKYLYRVGISAGVEYGRLRSFVKGEKWLPYETAKSVCVSLGIPEDGLEVIEDWGQLRQVKIPEVVTDDFARLFGFMIGDGFLSCVQLKSGCLAKRVGLALGSNVETNQKYIDLFSGFFGEGSRSDKFGRPNAYTIGSKLLYDFFILNGFIPGAENKRVPAWVYSSPLSTRIAFLEGLVDADGHRKESRSEGLRDSPKSRSVSLEMCNKSLVEDVRELAMQSGLLVGASVSERKRPGGHILEGRVMPEVTSYVLHFSFHDCHFDERTINSVEEVETDDIWDIGVEADEHNFVANGVVVHNTRAPSRYAFYVDVTGIPPNETAAYLNKVKQGLKKQKFVNPSTGKMDLKYDVLSGADDFFLPSREGKDTTRVESLQGPVYDHIEDVKFFENKLFAALKVPKPFLTYEETTAKSHLSAEDSRFARTILRGQSQIRGGYRRVCDVHLAFKGINPASVEYDIKMTIPSAIFELAQLEIKNAELELANNLKGWAPDYWIKQNVLGWSDDTIAEMRRLESIDSGEPSEPQNVPSGAIDRALSKRSQRGAAPDRGDVPAPEAPVDVEVASRLIQRDSILSSVQRNTKQLLERFELLKRRGKNEDKRLSRVESMLREIKMGQDSLTKR